MNDNVNLGDRGDEGVKYSPICDMKMSLKNDEKMRLLLEALKEKPFESDLLWSIFRAASESYKFDSLLRPFPKMFLDNSGEKMINKLKYVAASAPSLPEIICRLNEGTLNQELKDLIFWVLKESHSYKLKKIRNSEFNTILQRVQKQSRTALPNYIFEVDYSAKASTSRFQALAEAYGTRYAFHGSRLENFFSILNYGLQVSMNKVAVFGPGVYLASDLSVSLTFSPAGMSWGGSYFGGSFSLVALCEMIDHPDVKCQDDKLTSRNYAERCCPVPKKYFIVQNSQLVRVTHLLVYTTSPRTVRRTRWASIGCIPAMIVAYVILLLIIALYNSPYFTRKLPHFLNRHFSK